MTTPPAGVHTTALYQVRIGGALGGDTPGDTLRKGSVAILSNSGGFTTTIAQYLRLGGWGTTTLVSSGKDVYIHYAAPEFAHALSNDDRSKAAVLYCERGCAAEADDHLNRGRNMDTRTAASACRRFVA